MIPMIAQFNWVKIHFKGLDVYKFEGIDYKKNLICLESLITL